MFMIGQHAVLFALLCARTIKEILCQCPKGRKPFLQVIIDLTTLEKFGFFKEFKNLITRHLQKLIIRCLKPL